MPNRPRIALACAALAAVAGCATPMSRRDAYDQALAQWQGQSEDNLRARWGRPAAEEAAGHGRWLTYVVLAGATPPPTTTFSIGGLGFGGGRVGVGGGVAVSAPIGAPGPEPVACTTRFLVEEGKVSSWNFDGPGCGRAD